VETVFQVLAAEEEKSDMRPGTECSLAMVGL